MISLLLRITGEDFMARHTIRVSVLNSMKSQLSLTNSSQQFPMTRNHLNLKPPPYSSRRTPFLSLRIIRCGGLLRLTVRCLH